MKELHALKSVGERDSTSGCPRYTIIVSGGWMMVGRACGGGRRVGREEVWN